jgi:opacity protein-like surface antigen
MNLRRLLLLIVLAFLVAGSATPASAQKPQERKGFWFNAGVGYGSYGCEDCDARESGFSGGLSLGATLSPHVLLGIGTAGWTKTQDGVTLTVGTVDARVRIYPVADGGFFFTGGIELGNENDNGFGFLFGLGYDLRLGKNVSLTPFWNGFVINVDNSSANVGQIGLGVTIH